MLGKIFKYYNLIHRRIYDEILKKMFPADVLEIRKARINGYEMFVLVNEDVGRAIKYFNEYEKAETEFITSTIDHRATKVCIDVGANIGYFTLFLASVVKDAVIHSFEPIPTNFHICALNVEMNQFRNVVLNNCAVGNESGCFEFSVAQDGAYASFCDTKRKKEIEKIKVSVTTLDEYIYNRGVGKVGFMKIDVEGAEKMVLDGAKKLLCDQNRRPRTMMVELYDGNLKFYNTSIDEVVRSLDSMGYKPFIASDGSLKRFEKSHYNTICNVFFRGEFFG